MEISGKSSALLLTRRSLCFILLSTDSNDQEAPEKAGRLPSEGRGREFESRRVRHIFKRLRGCTANTDGLSEHIASSKARNGRVRRAARARAFAGADIPH